jgi:hypothetical protein
VELSCSPQFGVRDTELLYYLSRCKTLFGYPTFLRLSRIPRRIRNRKSSLRPGSSVVERGPEKAGVGGSIPSLATIYKDKKPRRLGAISHVSCTYCVLEEVRRFVRFVAPPYVRFSTHPRRYSNLGIAIGRCAFLIASILRKRAINRVENSTAMQSEWLNFCPIGLVEGQGISTPIVHSSSIAKKWRRCDDEAR